MKDAINKKNTLICARKQVDDKVKVNDMVADIAMYARKYWNISAVLKHEDRLVLEFKNGELITLNIKKIH